MSSNNDKEVQDLKAKVKELSQKEEVRSMWFSFRLKMLGCIIIGTIIIAVFTGD